jgi:methionine sulfoxide reductase heme-binding subunit
MSSGFVRRIVRVGKCGLLVAAGYAAVTALLLASARLAQVLGYPDLASRLPWYLSRAAGMTAYLLLSATTLLGLAVSTRIADRVIARPTVFGLHEYLAWLGLAATGLHLGGLLADTYLSFGVIDVAVPFAAPYRPGAVALGIVGLYLSAVLTGSFYVRARLGQRTWRAIHTTSFVAYVLATGHGILAGTSTSQPWMQWLYLLSGGAVLLLTNYRLLLATRARVERTTGASTQATARSPVGGPARRV